MVRSARPAENGFMIVACSISSSSILVVAGLMRECEGDEGSAFFAYADSACDCSGETDECTAE